MPLRDAVVGDTVSYRNADGETSNVLVLGVQSAAPSSTGFTATPSAADGTLASATYSYKLSVVKDGIETPCSAAKTAVVTGPTGSVDIDATAMIAAHPTATHWKVYGRSAGTELLIATTVVATPTYKDTGAVTPAGAQKTATASIRARNYGPHTLITDIPKATTLKGTSVYYKR